MASSKQHSITAGTVDPERITVFEHWRNQESLDAWRKIARQPGVTFRVTFKETSAKLYRTETAEESRAKRARL